MKCKVIPTTFSDKVHRWSRFDFVEYCSMEGMCCKCSNCQYLSTYQSSTQNKSVLCLRCELKLISLNMYKKTAKVIHPCKSSQYSWQAFLSTFVVLSWYLSLTILIPRRAGQALFLKSSGKQPVVSTIKEYKQE